jgi:DNA replication and repair protein RecF
LEPVSRGTSLPIGSRSVSTGRSAKKRLAEGGRGGKPVWDLEYASVLAEVDGLRSRFFELLRGAFQRVALDYPAMQDLTLEWRSGLPAADEIPAWLETHRDADIARGYSYLSPARADFLFRHERAPWVGSRGQNKLAGVLLQLAAEQIVSSLVHERAVWLIDDLSAELDPDIQLRLLPTLADVGDQALVTSLNEPTATATQLAPISMFHVEHGAVTPTPPAPDCSE